MHFYETFPNRETWKYFLIRRKKTSHRDTDSAGFARRAIRSSISEPLGEVAALLSVMKVACAVRAPPSAGEAGELLSRRKGGRAQEEGSAHREELNLASLLRDPLAAC